MRRRRICRWTERAELGRQNVDMLGTDPFPTPFRNRPLSDPFPTLLGTDPFPTPFGCGAYGCEGGAKSFLIMEFARSRRKNFQMRKVEKRIVLNG